MNNPIEIEITIAQEDIKQLKSLVNGTYEAGSIQWTFVANTGEDVIVNLVKDEFVTNEGESK